MYCEDVYNEEDVFILSASIPISNPEQISILKRLGVKSVEIDVSKGKDIDGGSKAEESSVRARDERPSPPESISNELVRARDVYGRTMETARRALKSLKLGYEFPAREIEEMADEVVRSILRNPNALMGLTQIKSYNEDIFEHSVNVAILTCSLAHALGYERDVLRDTCIGGLLHDIGKIWIPEHIVNKPGRFTDSEYAIMKRHPEYGIEIIKGRKGIPDLSKTIILQHHERLGGQGYPRGLKGNMVHPIGLIAGVTEVYEDMTSNRIYRPAMTQQLALATIYSGIDSEFPRLISERFIRLLGVYPVGSFVRLQGGEMGIVIRVNEDQFLAPDVLIVYSKDGKKLAAPEEYRLADMVKKQCGEKFAIEKSLDPRTYGIDVADFLKGKPTVS